MKPFYGKTLPSEFLQAMVDGLEAAEKHPKQSIWMGTYGKVFSEVCYGCAATWALQTLVGRELSEAEVVALGGWQELGGYFEDGDRVMEFEMAMDRARAGALWPLTSFCGLDEHALAYWEDRWALHTLDWADGLPAVRKAIKEMQAAGL